MATSALSLKNSFEDGTTRTLTLSPFATDAAAISNAKTNIMALNSAAGIENLRGKYISDNGYDFNGVKEATITTTQKTLVYSKTAALGAIALAADDGEGANNG